MRTPQEEQILAMRTIEWKRPEETLKETNKDKQKPKAPEVK